jgi:hypothetical protein
MKRVAAVLSSALLMVLITAGTVLAQTTTYPPEPTTSVIGGGGGTGNVDNVGGTAFTGADVSFGAIAFAALLVVGVAALFVARRRAARLAG